MNPRKVTAVAIVISLLGFELLVLVILALFPYIMDPGLAALNNSAYTLLAPLSTLLVLGTLFALPVRFAVSQTWKYSPQFNRFLRFLSEPLQKTLSSTRTTSLSVAASNLRVISHPRWMLITSLAISVLLAFVPYRPDLNPTGSLVGVDSSLYIGWISQMLARPLPQAFQYSFVQGFEGSRPLLLITLYLVASTGVSPSAVIEYLPIFLAPFLTLAAYVFVRYSYGSVELAGLTSVLTSVSFYTPIGLWGGYYANWLAVAFAYLFMTTLPTFSKNPTPGNYVSMLALSLGLFLTHPWTWVLVLAVSLAFGVTVWRETRNLVHLGSIVTIIASGVILDIFKSLFFATPTVATDIATKVPSGLGSILGFWNSLVEALLYTNGGLMADWLLLGLAATAAFGIRFRNRFERLLLLWTAVPVIPFVALDSYSQSRILYDLPIPIMASVAALFLITWARRESFRSSILLVLVLLLATLTHSLQSIPLLL